MLVNLDKQPLHIHRPDGSQIDFTYDSAGRLSTTTYPSGPSTSDGSITVTRTYNPTTGKLASVSTSDGQSLAYDYDGSLVTSTTWSGNLAGSVGWTYNSDFRVATEGVNGANRVSYGYDNDGLLTSVDGLTLTRDQSNGLVSDTTIGQVTDHRTYDSFGKLATYEAKFGSLSLYSVSYVSDSLGRIEQKTETVQGTTTVWNYSYDSAGRLWQVMQNGTTTASYLYDANGNRITVTTPSGPQTASCDAQDRLLTRGSWSYTYTANGDLQSKTDTNTGQITTYSYDALGNLRHVGLPDGRSIDYLLDSPNRRVAKKINGSLVRRWTYRSQLKPAAEFDGAGSLLARYMDGVIVKGSTSYRVVTDHLGTPRLLVNTNTGAVAQRLDVGEWGQVSADSSVGFQVFGFAGGIYDPDTGLVRFGARDYDPEIGRWTAKDPVGFGGRQTNLFVYVNNDPINLTDVTGLGQLSTCVQNLLRRYFPGVDLSQVDVEIGIPWTTRALDWLRREPGDAMGVTKGKTIYIEPDLSDFNQTSNLNTLAHEITHWEQINQIGGGLNSELWENLAGRYGNWVEEDLDRRGFKGCDEKCD